MRVACIAHQRMSMLPCAGTSRIQGQSRESLLMNFRMNGIVNDINIDSLRRDRRANFSPKSSQRIASDALT